MSLDFGSRVKIISSEATTSLSLSGLEGEVRGVSDPNCSQLSPEDTVIGEIDPNFSIYAVYFSSLDKLYWFSPKFLEVIDAMPPLEMKLGNRHIKRDQSGTWFEKNKDGEWIIIEEP